MSSPPPPQQYQQYQQPGPPIPSQYRPPPQPYYPQPPSPPPKKEESFTQRYFYWLTPAIGIYLFLIFVVMIMSWVTVGSQFSSVPKACATWSFDCTTSQD